MILSLSIEFMNEVGVSRNMYIFTWNALLASNLVHYLRLKYQERIIS